MDNAVYDCVILGAGPAGLTAGLYLGRYGYNVVIYEKSVIGGNLVKIEKLENYPGYRGGGEALAKTLREQLGEVEVMMKYGECKGLRRDGGVYCLGMDDGELRAKTVIVATGKVPREVELPAGIDKPVSTCATCDGPLYRGKSVVVLGGGNSAASGAITLAKLAKSIKLVSRSALKADAELIEQLQRANNLKMCERVDFTETNDEYLQLLRDADAIFMFIGSEPATDFLSGFTELLDGDGYVLTGVDNMTMEPGIFAAGDARKGATNQVISAAADGAITAISVKKYLESGNK